MGARRDAPETGEHTVAVSKTWRERIADARARGRFDEVDVELVSDFATCAVGEIMHCGSGGPTDSVLEQLGFDFCAALDARGRRAFAKAEKVLHAIEDRALQLKREGVHPEGVHSEATQP